MQRVLSLLIAGLVGFAAGSAAIETRVAQAAETASAEAELRIGLSLQPSNALVMIALDQGYFRDEGIRVSVEHYVSGKRALLDGLFAGKVDLVTASDVPIVFNSFERQDFSVIATIFHVDNQNRIVARADSGIESPKDLRGKRLATQKSSAVHFFLHLFLLENGMSDHDVALSFMKAGELPESLARGEIDAFSMREPYIGQAKALLGSNAVVFAAPGLYYQSDQLVAANGLLEERPEAVRKVLRALVRSEQFVRANPKDSQEIVARSLGAGSAEIAAIWPELTPRVSLEQSLLLRLEDIARWALKRRLVEGREIPNLLDLMHLDGLEAVKPEAVTVIR